LNVRATIPPRSSGAAAGAARPAPIRPRIRPCLSVRHQAAFALSPCRIRPSRPPRAKQTPWRWRRLGSFRSGFATVRTAERRGFSGVTCPSFLQGPDPRNAAFHTPCSTSRRRRRSRSTPCFIPLATRTNGASAFQDELCWNPRPASALAMHAAYCRRP
jgi:hypothetical protein